jgi:hypothetical protein
MSSPCLHSARPGAAQPAWPRARQPSLLPSVRVHDHGQHGWPQRKQQAAFVRWLAHCRLPRDSATELRSPAASHFSLWRSQHGGNDPARMLSPRQHLASRGRLRQYGSPNPTPTCCHLRSTQRPIRGANRSRSHLDPAAPQPSSDARTCRLLEQHSASDLRWPAAAQLVQHSCILCRLVACGSTQRPDCGRLQPTSLLWLGSRSRLHRYPLAAVDPTQRQPCGHLRPAGFGSGHPAAFIGASLPPAAAHTIATGTIFGRPLSFGSGRAAAFIECWPVALTPACSHLGPHSEPWLRSRSSLQVFASTLRAGLRATSGRICLVGNGSRGSLCRCCLLPSAALSVWDCGRLRPHS